LRGDFQKAVSEYEQAIAIRPHAKTLSNLGVVYRRLAQYDQAFKTYEEALKIDPVSKEAH
jgi:tetratricopeptide (TPR) repeat protein